MNSLEIYKIIELFDSELHIVEIIPSKPFETILYSCKGNLSNKQANEILRNNIPIKDKWEYKQDKRIKSWKITTRYIF